MARIEKKIDKGHKGFEVDTSASLSYKEAALRRDFTINSIGYDYLKEILDPYKGIKDLENKILRHIKRNFYRRCFKGLSSRAILLKI